MILFLPNTLKFNHINYYFTSMIVIYYQRMNIKSIITTVKIYGMGVKFRRKIKLVVEQQKCELEPIL